MTVLLIIAGILLFLFLLTLLPVQIFLGYGEKLEIQVKLLFYKLPILGDKAQEDADKQDETPVEKIEKGEESLLDKIKALKEREGISGFLNFFQEFTGLLLSAVHRILRYVEIKQFRLHLIAGGEDAAAAALLYGQACAVVPPAYAMLFSYKKCKKKSARVDLDYQAKQSTILFTCQLQIRILFLLAVGLQALVQGLPLIRRLRKGQLQIREDELQ